MKQNAKPLTMKVYEKVYGDIVDGFLTSNDILTEGALVEQMQVSKSPVREALILLCEEGVLQSIPRRGYQILQITQDQIRALIEARAALEPFLLRKAWPHLQGEVLCRLKEHLAFSKQDEKLHTSIRDNWRRNIAFHLLLAGYANNEYLLNMLEHTLQTCERAAAQYFHQVRGIPQGEVDLHNTLMDAIGEENLKKAEEILLADIRELI